MIAGLNKGVMDMIQRYSVDGYVCDDEFGDLVDYGDHLRVVLEMQARLNDLEQFAKWIAENPGYHRANIQAEAERLTKE